jgi:hypothetical protein
MFDAKNGKFTKLFILGLRVTHFILAESRFDISTNRGAKRDKLVPSSRDQCLLFSFFRNLDNYLSLKSKNLTTNKIKIA